jgi:hypothetical protein
MTRQRVCSLSVLCRLGHLPKVFIEVQENIRSRLILGAGICWVQPNTQARGPLLVGGPRPLIQYIYPQLKAVPPPATRGCPSLFGLLYEPRTIDDDRRGALGGMRTGAGRGGTLPECHLVLHECHVPWPGP